MFQKMEFLPGFCYRSFHLRGSHAAYRIIIIYRQKGKERVSRCNRKLLSPRRFKFRCKSRINGAESQLVVVGPDLVRLFSRKSLKFRETARSCKPDIIHFGKFIKIHKLIVDPVFLLFCSGRQDPGDNTGNGNSVVILQNAYPLVPLFHIEFIHILICLDGIPDALI